MRKQIIYYSICILFGVSSMANAQRLYELTPYSFYQEWSLIEKESNEGLLIYKPIKNLYSAANTLIFSRINNEWFVLKTKAVKPQPFDSAIPKNNKQGICPTGDWMDRTSNRTQEEGIWNVYLKDESKFLILKPKTSKHSKDYDELDKKEEFQIVSLEEDKMVLRKVNDHAGF